MHCKTIVSMFFSACSLVLCLMVPPPLQAEEDLDIALLRERIRKVHGDFNVKLNGSWVAAIGGKTESWTWGNQGWLCGKKDSSCASWTPKSFSLWQKGSFLQNWIPKTKVGFEVHKALGRPRPSSSVAPDQAAASHDDGATEIDWGQNAVGELWIFENSKSETIKVLVSARDQRIDRMESEEGLEYFEWALSRKTGLLELSRVILERNGTRAALLRK